MHYSKEERNLERTGQIVIPPSLPGFAIFGGSEFDRSWSPFLCYKANSWFHILTMRDAVNAWMDPCFR